jgi:hypothetical protein
MMMMTEKTTPDADAEAGKQAMAHTGALHAITGLGKLIGGRIYKPDADHLGACARCGRAGSPWITGAGENLCARHQDDY